MFGILENTSAFLIDTVVTTCAESGGTCTTVSVKKRNPATYTVYVGHPISGIRVARILQMQETINEAFLKLNEGSVQSVKCLFPMRTTHLASADIGANEYEDGASLFSDTRHFTLQNRMDAIMASDAVLVNFDLKDDAGNFRVSKGIPFDYGWAAAKGKPVVVAMGEGNPNACAALERVAETVPTIEGAVSRMNAILRHTHPVSSKRVVADVFDFTGAGSALSMISMLASADANKHMDGGRAIISIIPEGREAACWHGQIAQVSDWIVKDATTARSIVSQLIG